MLKEAGQIQAANEPSCPRLYSLRGFRYCELLIWQGAIDEAIDHAEYALNKAIDSANLLDIALSQLILGLAYVSLGNFSQSSHWLEQAMVGLRKAGQQWFMPIGLLMRAALHRQTGDFALARQDLQEIFDIAEPSGMRLHLADYHLEMARTLLAEAGIISLQSASIPMEDGIITARKHVEKAAKLISETGYKRRLPELRALQEMAQMQGRRAG